MKKLWLIGSGPMAYDYDKVLKSLSADFIVIGRGDASAAAYETQTKTPVIRGGLQAYLKSNPSIPEMAIVSVGIEQLAATTLCLLNNGIKKILVEKPAGLYKKEILKLNDASRAQKAEVYVAYNRRFYSSVIKSQGIIQEDGGVTSFHFEFTEWSHTITPLQKAPGIKEMWLLGNSSHVIDLAFYLGGKPTRDIACYISKGNLSWHPNASVFTGAGQSVTGALFSYHANWEAPGRWGLEILTKKHRLIYRPLEKLQIQNIGSVSIDPVTLDDTLDVQFKPGLYLQVKHFVEGNTESFCTINEMRSLIDSYYKIAHY